MIIIYTDGSCTPNPGKGTCAFIAVGSVHDTELHRDVKVHEETTNNRMELQAVINAIDWFYQVHHDKGVDKFKIITDSQYVKNGITEWIIKWKANGWKGSGGKNVLNKGMWKDLDTLIGYLDTPLEWQWTKGHANDKWNNEVDKLCKTGYDINPSVDALDRAFKKLGHQGLKNIVDKVHGMNIKGPTVEEYFMSFTFDDVMDISFEFLTYVREHGNDMNGILTGNKKEAFKRWYNEVYLKK